MALTLSAKIIIEALDKASGVFGKIGKNATAVGKSMVAIGAAPTAALGLATKSAIEYESAFAGVRKTVDASEAEFDQLSRNIRDIAKNSPTSVNALAGIGEMAGQLGVTGVDNLTSFIDTISKISVTTDLTEESASQSFARIANIMGEPIENVDKMASTVVGLGNNFATTESQIVNFANRIAGAGQIAGLQTQNIFAIGAAMSSVGVEAEAGGTAVQKVLLSMNEAVTQNTGALETFAATAGITAQEFAEVYEEDAMAAFVQFVDGLGSAGDDAIGILDELELKDQRLIRAFLSLANAQGLVGDAYNKSAKDWMENIALTDEANKRYGTSASQLQIMRNKLNDVGITVGTAVAPAIIALVDAITPLIEKFGEFTEKHPNIVAGALAIGAAIGLIGGAILVLTPIVTTVGAAFAALGVTWGGTLAVAGTVVTLLTGPLALAIGAIVLAVGALFFAWKNNWGGIREKTAAAKDFIVNTIKALGDRVTQNWNAIGETLVQKARVMWEGIQHYFGKIKDMINGVIDRANEAINKIRESLSFGGGGGNDQRQFGGPVSAAKTYLVGESGPELFTPSTAGSITPNNKIGVAGQSGPPLQIIINANNIVNSANERRSFAEAILKDLQTMARAQNINLQELADRVV